MTLHAGGDDSSLG